MKVLNMKKALHLSGKANMIDQFCIPNILLLQSLGYNVSVATDYSDPGTISVERADNLKKKFSSMSVGVFDVSFPRSLNPIALFSAYRAIKSIIKRERFDLIHCHSPIGAAVCRMAARNERKRGTKIIYTAHGFHFYKGAPLKNWLVYYPIEYLLSKYTDVLITINREDFQQANRRLKAKKIFYVPGVGVDTDKFSPKAGDGARIRTELGISDSKTMILSVGELNKNKNHEQVIKGLEGVDAVYVIVGKGPLNSRLKDVAKECSVDLRLVGYRTDVIDFYSAADVYVLPSLREGLSVSLMEAMACGLSIACSNIRGNNDLIDSCLFDPHNSESIRAAILMALDKKKDLGEHNRVLIDCFSLTKVNDIMRQIYEDCI